jgi:exosome complex RNA-binding protein Csl4
MKKLANTIMALVLAVSFAGCAGMNSGMVKKDAKVKCPHCGKIYTVEEGIKQSDGGG